MLIVAACNLKVLEKLVCDDTNPMIALHLIVAINAIDPHTKNIYARRDPTCRTEAVGYAHQLGLLEA